MFTWIKSHGTRATSAPSPISASATSSSSASLTASPVSARSRKLDYPLATLGPQNKFFGGYGWRWHFWQGLWYRWLVDREIGKLKPRK